MVPEQLGPYRIGRRLGRGGMGTVYEAVNTSNNETAAVKVLHPSLGDEEGFRERFEIEVETLKKLRHPQIVRLYGFGAQGETLYYAMEYVNGTNLEEELQNGRRFTWREVTQAGIKLARALKLAHDHGIIHRDLKPANVLLSSDEDIKLTDFGIAKLFGTYRLTSDGGLIGTAEYMSPEQAEGKPVTAQSDLYSLGGVLFAMLTGRPPFRAKSLPEVLQMQRFAEPPRATQFAPDTPAALADILTRLLSKNPAERAANAGMLAKELSAMEHGLSAKSLREDATATPQQMLDALSLSQSETLAGEVLPADSNASPLDPNQPTRIADAGGTRSSYSGKVSAASPASDAPTLQARVTAGAPQPSAAPLRVLRENRFLTVEEDEAEAAKRQAAEERRRKLFQSLAILTILAALVAVTLYTLRPPSADALYQKLAQGRAEGATLLEQEATLTQFVELYPHDARIDEVQAWQEELALTRLERQLHVRANTILHEESTPPLVREYLLANQVVEHDPPTALRRWQAIVQLYGMKSNTPLTAEEEQCLELTKQKIARWQPIVAKTQSAELAQLKERLDQAKKLAATDQPQARAILEGIITLYSDRPWAEPITSQARRALEDVQQVRSEK
jgi:eukaryotic-like serine/threonine-protein kinase